MTRWARRAIGLYTIVETECSKNRQDQRPGCRPIKHLHGGLKVGVEKMSLDLATRREYVSQSSNALGMLSFEPALL